MADDTGRKKTERLHMLISPDEIAAIENYRFANRISTRAEAVRRLCQIGLLVGPLAKSLPDVVMEVSSTLQDLDNDVMALWTTLANPTVKGESVKRSGVLAMLETFTDHIMSLEDRMDDVTTSLIALNNGVVEVSGASTMKQGLSALDYSIEKLDELHRQTAEARAKIRENRKKMREFGYNETNDNEVGS